MKNALRWSLILALGVTLAASVAHAGRSLPYSDYHWEQYSPTHPDTKSEADALASVASAGTTVLGSWNFDSGAFTCDAQGWTAVDLSIAPGMFFHVDDYAGLPAADYSPIDGSHSLWCGTRANPGDPIVCSYETAPGYGNNWDQVWQTKNCIPVSGDDILDVDFVARWSSHYSYCGQSIEYSRDCTGAVPNATQTWIRVLGAVGIWTDLAPNVPVDFDSVMSEDFPVVPSGTGTVQVRFRFQSHFAYSDEDGVYPTNGALHIDDLKVEGLALEDFEGEAVGATQSNDWIAGNMPGFGNYFALFSGLTLAQDDPCRRDVSCMWAAINGSTFTYACGGKPAQLAVPRGNANGAYIHNEIWSPLIDLGTTTGSVLNMEFSVYRDLPLDDLVFYIWRVRQYDDGPLSCPGAWHDTNIVYYSSSKDWSRQRIELAPLLDLSTATHIQVSLGVVDNYGVWGAFESCHSHAPLFDTVRVYRVDGAGPQWVVRDLEQFQDNFAEIVGPWAGTVRADAANSIRANGLPGIDPGDSSILYSVTDPEAGIAPDGAGGYKVYIYLSTWPQGQAGKTGPAVTQDASSHPGASYPWVGSTVINGVTWDIVRCQLVGDIGSGRFRIDLNDCLWETGDTVCFFYGAENNDGVKTYGFGSALALTTSNMTEAATNASEFTCLPAGGWNHGGNILYVDGMDGRGGQQFFDTAFQALGSYNKVDRYDVRGPSSSVGNRPSTRIKDISQLLNCYQVLVWDTGDLTVGIGQGKNVTGQPAEKSPDCLMLFDFLNGLTSPGGVYLAGDDQPGGLAIYSQPQAISFKTYITYTMSNPSGGNHVAKGYPITPLINVKPGGCFTDPFYAYGGCLLINDFDVMTAQGGGAGTSQWEGSYGAPNAGNPTNAAIIGQTKNNPNAVQVHVMLGGFSFIYIRDDENDGVMDRALHMHDIIQWLGTSSAAPTGTGTAEANSLSQNYPNPFNPQTTIAFSVKERGLVNLKVYNVAGQLVRTLANEEFAAGAHTKVWDGKDDAGQAVASGVYFYKLVAKDFSRTRKMVLLK